MPAGKRDKIRVVLAEDQAMVLGALAALLEMEDDIDIAAGFFHETSIANVTKYDVQIFSGLWRYLIEPS